jgi:uncharacterized protein YkwD
MRLVCGTLALAAAVLATSPTLHARDDPWRRWVAGEAACPGGADATAPAARQVRTMLCLVNYARKRQRLEPLVLSPALINSSRAKARDIVRCGVFEHEACGREPDARARETGYRGAWGENLFVATGSLAAPRVAIGRWLNSRGHRGNLFRAGWRTLGIARQTSVDVGRIHRGVLWVNQFGE